MRDEERMNATFTKLTTSNQQLATFLFLLSCPAFAYDFAGGTGEPNDPFRIATAEQLISIDSDPNLSSKRFVLINDIDLDPNLPGGRIFDRELIRGLSGGFDGAGFVVRNLTIKEASEDYVGLFGYIEEAGQVQHLGLENVSIIRRFYPPFPDTFLGGRPDTFAGGY